LDFVKLKFVQFHVVVLGFFVDKSLAKCQHYFAASPDFCLIDKVPKNIFDKQIINI